MNSTSAGQPTSALPLTVPGVNPFSCSHLTLNLEKSFSGGLFVFWGFHVESFIKVLPFTEVTSTCLEEKAEKGWGTDGQTFFFFFLSPERMGRGELKFSDLLNHSCSSLQKLWKLQRRKSKNSTNFLRSLDDQLCSGQPGGDNNLPQRGSPSEMPHQRL